MAQLIQSQASTASCIGFEEDHGELSAPKLEMLEFIRTSINLLGPRATGYLTDLWLDELANLECLPSPTSHAWKLVSLGASARLASRLIEEQLGNCALW